MKVVYYLNEGRKKNLYCRISDASERVSFSLGHIVDAKNWDAKKNELTSDDPYYYALEDFKKYLEKQYHGLKSERIPVPDILNQLKIEADSFVSESGVDGIARKMFDMENKDDDISPYDQFVAAFEKHSGLTKGEYIAETVDNLIHFRVKDDNFEMDTYAGLTARLKSFIDRKSYEEICMMTNEAYWSEIYTDAGIEKHKFLPVMLGEWETFWSKKYDKIRKEVGKTDHLDERKNVSWRQFQVYMECYNGHGDSIELAYEIDDMELYPIAVITMMGIFNADVCYEEYCEMEFFQSNEWESIDLHEEDEDPNGDGPVFFIRPADS